MYFKKIFINKFSGLSGVNIEPNDGVNIIFGGNEAGKSTVSAFIKFVFYGFENKNERTRYMPWGDNTASGYIVINKGGKDYRVSREVCGTKENVEVTELSSNVRDDGIKDVGLFFFGIPYNVFSNTVFVRQIEGARVDGEDVGHTIDNILFSADERIDTEKAKKKLEDARKELLHKNKKGGSIYELEQELDAIGSRIAAAESTDLVRQNKSVTLENIKKSYGSKAADMKALKEELEKYDCGLAARQYGKAKQYKAAAEACELKISVIKAKYGSADSFPTEKTLARLCALKEECDAVEKELADTVMKLSENERQLSDISPRAESAKELAEIGGKLSVMKKYRKYSSLRNAFAVCAGIFAAAAAILFVLKSNIFGIALSAAAGISLAIFAIFALAEKKILKKYGTENKKTLEMVLSSAETDKETIEKLNSEHLQLRSKRAELEEKYKNILPRAKEAANKAGKEDIDPAIDEIRTVLSELSENEAELKKNKELFENAMAPLKIYTKFDLEEMIKRAPEKEWTESFPYAEKKARYRMCADTIEMHGNKIHELEKQLIELDSGSDDLDELYDKKQSLTSELAELRRRHDAIVLAYEKLDEASAELKSSIGPKLSAYAGELLEKLSGGKYSVMGINNDMELQYEAEHNGSVYSRDISYMSAGTADMAYLSVRFALSSFIGKNEKMPMIFDESFARLDDTRLARMLDMISSEKVQSVIFTSHKREAEIMDGIGKYKLINL